MADLYTARTAIDFQQDLFHELGVGMGRPDEDELWGKITSLALSIFCALSSLLLLSFFLCPRYFGISTVNHIGWGLWVLWEQIKCRLCGPPPHPTPPLPWVTSPRANPRLDVFVCLCERVFISLWDQKLDIYCTYGDQNPHKFEVIFETQNVFFLSGLQLGYG